ncbi:hypothetical protein HispidOSU_028215, partial [Sigmodon hispidus]
RLNIVVFHNASTITGFDQSEIQTFARKLVTLINEHKQLSSLLSVGSLDEGPASALVIPKAFTYPALSAVTDFIVDSFALLECGIFRVSNSLQVSLDGRKARTSSD